MRIRFAQMMIVAVLACASVAAQAAAPASLEANKKLVRDFFTAVAMRDKAALGKIVREDYIQHAPNVETGLQGILKFIDRALAQGPAPTTVPDIGVVRIVAEGDMVVVELRRQNPQGLNAAADFFRIQDGKIAEHWGVQQAVPEDQALNKNGFF
jgi:predicted SnoaL-like aldol condensation-catalyzing enzyme